MDELYQRNNTEPLSSQDVKKWADLYKNEVDYKIKSYAEKDVKLEPILRNSMLDGLEQPRSVTTTAPTVSDALLRAAGVYANIKL